MWTAEKLFVSRSKLNKRVIFRWLVCKNITNFLRCSPKNLPRSSSPTWHSVWCSRLPGSQAAFCKLFQGQNGRLWHYWGVLLEVFFYLVRNLIELAKKFTDSYGNVTTIRYKKNRVNIQNMVGRPHRGSNWSPPDQEAGAWTKELASWLLVWTSVGFSTRTTVY